MGFFGSLIQVQSRFKTRRPRGPGPGLTVTTERIGNSTRKDKAPGSGAGLGGRAMMVFLATAGRGFKAVATRREQRPKPFLELDCGSYIEYIDCSKSFRELINEFIKDKAKPVARQGRKAAGLLER